MNTVGKSLKVINALNLSSQCLWERMGNEIKEAISAVCNVLCTIIFKAWNKYGKILRLHEATEGCVWMGFCYICFYICSKCLEYVQQALCGRWDVPIMECARVEDTGRLSHCTLATILTEQQHCRDPRWARTSGRQGWETGCKEPLGTGSLITVPVGTQRLLTPHGWECRGGNLSSSTQSVQVTACGALGAVVINGVAHLSWEGLAHIHSSSSCSPPKRPLDKKRFESLMWVDPYDLGTENPKGYHSIFCQELVSINFPCSVVSNLSLTLSGILCGSQRQRCWWQRGRRKETQGEWGLSKERPAISCFEFSLFLQKIHFYKKYLVVQNIFNVS